MAKPATTSAEVATKVQAFIDAGRPLSAGRGGRWSVVALVRELGFVPAENYVQYLWKNKEVLDVLNSYAVEQGLAAVGSTPEENAADAALRKRYAKVASQAREDGQAAAMARSEVRVLSERVQALEQENVTLRAENEALKARIASIRNGFLHRLT
jgi:hypothetical protein